MQYRPPMMATKRGFPPATPPQGLIRLGRRSQVDVVKEGMRITRGARKLDLDRGRGSRDSGGGSSALIFLAAMVPNLKLMREQLYKNVLCLQIVLLYFIALRLVLV